MHVLGCVKGALGGGLRYSVCISQKTLWLKLVEKLNADVTVSDLLWESIPLTGLGSPDIRWL